MVNNNAIFERIWRRAAEYGLSFISSNGGTGKTVYFKFRLLRDAIERGIHFHVFCRFGNQRELTAQSFLDDKPTYSKRQRRLLARCEIEKDGDKFVYITDTRTGVRIAQIVDIYGQSFYKSFGNLINAKRALFDEVLAENGEYCPDELNKFNRLVFTMARSNDYHVFCLYNNTSPNFPYFTYFGGKNYASHVGASGALFIFFTSQAWSASDAPKSKKSIQSIIQSTDYNSVYTQNSFARYPVFYSAADIRGATIVCKLEISTRIFRVRFRDGVVYLDSRRAWKKSKHALFSINRRDETTLPLLPPELRGVLAQYKRDGAIKTTNMNDTIFAKILCEYL